MTQKIALVTGGASGIGKATALELARQGVTVVISGRNTEKGAMAVQEIKAAATGQAQVRFESCDVTDEAAVQGLIGKVVQDFGRLDMAVNNAGIYNESATIDQSDTQNFRDMLETNVLGVYYGMKYQIAQMKQQGSGAIVNLASIAGLNGVPWTATYCASKHAVVGLTKAAAVDHAAEGIRINAVAPGAIHTDIIAAQIEAAEAELDAMHPIGRMGQPEEIAQGIVWLLSQNSGFVAGHILNIDGGFQAK